MSASELANRLYDACLDMDHMDYEDTKDLEIAVLTLDLEKVSNTTKCAIELLIDLVKGE